MTVRDSLPSPLVPSEVDLRDFAFMPLDVLRLRDSDLASEETPEACWAAVLLWCAAWHQVPAASIPDSDMWQAKQTGYVSRGRIDKGWAQVKSGALRGWVLCTDGRLYHPVIAEKALDAWHSKLVQRWKTECSRIKKHADRHGIKLARPEFEQWLAAGCPQGQPLPVPGDTPGTTRGQSGETSSKGQGEGQGQGYLSPPPEGATAAPPPVAPPPRMDLPSARDVVFALGVPLLTAASVKESNARSFLAMQAKQHGDQRLVDVLKRCAIDRPVQPVSWIQAQLNPNAKPGKHSGFASKDYREGVAEDGSLA